MEPRPFDLIGMPNGSILETHAQDRCAGDICCIHNPSDHPMRDWPQYWRSDANFMERVCPHGVGHPDPDDLRVKNIPGYGIHGCDGCCQKEKK